MTEIQTAETRSAGVTAAATLGILCSISAFLVWGWFFLGVISLPADIHGKHFWRSHLAFFLALAFVPPLLVAFGLRISVGLFHLKPWARRGALVWGGLAFVLGSLLIAFQPYETFVIPDEFVSAASSIKQLLALAFVIFTFPLGAWWLFYFTRIHVIRQFSEASRSQTPATTN